MKLAHGVGEADRLLSECVPDFAVVDLRMPDESGLQLVAKLGGLKPPV